MASNGTDLPPSSGKLALQSSQNDSNLSNSVDFTNVGRVLPTTQTSVSNGDSTKIPYQSNQNPPVPDPPSPVTKQVVLDPNTNYDAWIQEEFRKRGWL